MSKDSSETDAASQGHNKISKKVAEKFGNPWRVIALAAGIFLLTQLLAAIIIEIALAIMHSEVDVAGAIEKSAPAQFFYILLAEGGAVGFVILLLKRRGLNLKSIGLGRRFQSNDIVKALLGFAAFFALLVVVNSIISAFFPEINSEQQDVGFNTLNSNLDWSLAIISLVIFPPIGEEILVRGYLYSGLRANWRFIPSMLVTSLLFGLAHLQLGSGAAVVWAAGVDTFVLSMVLVYLRENTGALYAGILVHALNNLIAFGVHFK